MLTFLHFIENLWPITRCVRVLGFFALGHVIELTRRRTLTGPKMWLPPLYSQRWGLSGVCVLTGIWNEKYDQNMRWWDSKPQSGISQVLDYAAYCYVILTRHPWYSNPCSSYHTSSSKHMGIPCLRPRISAWHTSSFSQLIWGIKWYMFIFICFTLYTFDKCTRSIYSRTTYRLSLFQL